MIIRWIEASHKVMMMMPDIVDDIVFIEAKKREKPIDYHL